MKTDNIELENTSSEKLLGITIDSKLNFKEHLEGIIKKASRKVNVLSRISPYMNLTKRKLLMNSFFASQFNCCPLVWMCHNRTISKKINLLHERCLHIIHNDNKSLFWKLLDKDKGVTIHVNNVRPNVCLKCQITTQPHWWVRYLISKIMSTTFEILLNLLDQMYKVSSMILKAFLVIVLNMEYCTYWIEIIRNCKCF